MSATSPTALPLLGTDLLDRGMDVVDLTRPIYEGMPQWFGHQKTFIMRNQTHEEFKETWKTSCGFEAHNLLISEHCGTHTDAVFEYDESGPASRRVAALVLVWAGALPRPCAADR